MCLPQARTWNPATINVSVPEPGFPVSQIMYLSQARTWNPATISVLVPEPEFPVSQLMYLSQNLDFLCHN